MRNNVGAGQRSPFRVPSRRADVHRSGASKHSGIRGFGPALHKGFWVRLLALKAATTHAPHRVSLNAESDRPTLFSGVTVGVIIMRPSLVIFTTKSHRKSRILSFNFKLNFNTHILEFTSLVLVSCCCRCRVLFGVFFVEALEAAPRKSSLSLVTDLL